MINPLYALAGGITLAATLATGGLWLHARGLQADLRERDETIAALRVDIGKCSDRVREQNAAMARLVDNAAAARENARQALERAQMVSKGRQAQIDALQAQILRPPPEAGCAAALDIVREQLQ